MDHPNTPNIFSTEMLIQSRENVKVVIDGKATDMRALWFEDGKLKMIDQRLLPFEIRVISLSHCNEVAEAIKNMAIRGAPSIGAAAAYGLALAVIDKEDISNAANLLRKTRPTAYDLFYAIDYMVRSIQDGRDPVEAANSYANAIVERCRLIGKHGCELIRDGYRVMTHCNAGALASVDIGTALAPIRFAHTQSKHFFVYVSETRPRLQGMRLTSWELQNEGIPHAVIVDGASGHYMKKDVDVVIVGADRIASNGDFANKIGTYEKAVIAHELDIPFFVAAPISTFDFNLNNGDEIPIELRSEEEVIAIENVRIAPRGVMALNPSFDITPGKYVTGFITEIGILRPSELGEIAKIRS